ncbi:MAG: hypothetical protein KAS85_02485 [Rhodobacteraceae bacterium]|nr:hypothetical protein [Paracoccaceae bacterium]
MKYPLITMLLLFPTLALAQEDGTEIHSLCNDIATCAIPYVRLSKQETEPFLFLGKVVDEQHARYNDYRKSILRFPNVLTCLKEEERGKSEPDLRQIDWDMIHNTREMEVCVFRIASSIEDVEYIKIWLQYHGYRVDDILQLSTERNPPRYDTGPWFSFQGHLTIEKFREIIPRFWLARLIGFEGARNHTLTVSFSKEGQVVGAYAFGNSIFN